MYTSINRSVAGVALAVAALGTGCGEPAAPQFGSIVITVGTPEPNTNWDLDGYVVSVDGGASHTIAPNQALTIPGLQVGDHEVWVDGLAPNCLLTGHNPRQVRVERGEVSVTFLVTCGPKTGTVQVSAVTSGSELDTDGYSLVVGSRVSSGVPANGSFNMTGIPEGDHSVSLGGVSDNCAVDAPHPRMVTVGNGQVVSVGFVISCVPSAGLRVTTTSSGVDLDVNGYDLRVSQYGRFFSGNRVPTNGTLTIGALMTGTYTVELHDIAANCIVVPANRREATVVAGSITAVAIDINCSAPNRLAYVESFGTLADVHLVNTNGTAAVRLTTEAGADLDPAWSPDGTRIAFASARHGIFEIYVMAATGANPVRLTNGGVNDQPAWSPDGSKIAFVSRPSGNPDIYVMNADGTGVIRLTTENARDEHPAWSPDGSKIAFDSDRGGTAGIWVMNADGSSPTRLTSALRADTHPAWSPDGTRIAYVNGVGNYGSDIWIMKADGSGKVALTFGYEDVLDPAWSPDGDKIAFTSNSYYYNSHIVIIGLDGIAYTLPRYESGATNPSWRP